VLVQLQVLGEGFYGILVQAMCNSVAQYTGKIGLFGPFSCSSNSITQTAAVFARDKNSLFIYYLRKNGCSCTAAMYYDKNSTDTDCILRY
jgi:hypothetical protein